VSGTYPILRSLDPHHARIGYLGALAFVATRALDRPDALMARFQDLIFERIYPKDPRFAQLLSLVDEERRPELLARQERPEDEDPSAAFSQSPGAVESAPTDWLLTPRPKRPQRRLVHTEWLYISEFWLHHRLMPSPLGLLTRDKAHRTLDLARSIGVLLPTLELSEAGYLIQHLLMNARANVSAPAHFNPLLPDAHPALPIVYFRQLLEHEMLLPFLILQLTESEPAQLATRGRTGLLLRSVERMLAAIGDTTDPESAMELRTVDEFREAIAVKDSTQENYLRPRMEILVDLGLLGRRRRPAEGRAEFVWEPTERTRLLSRILAPLAGQQNRTRTFLDEQLFAAWTALHGSTCRLIDTDQERLFWFARAFEQIGREFGFTPARTLAMKACILAWESGAVMEIGNVLKTVYEAAKTDWGRYLRFSGGSRFDSEFLIRIDEAMLPELRRTGGVPGEL